MDSCSSTYRRRRGHIYWDTAVHSDLPIHFVVGKNWFFDFFRSVVISESKVNIL